MRLLTFQSKEVLELLLSETHYYADSTKSREMRDYSQDIEQLNGYQPIWCFSPVGLSSVAKSNIFSECDFKDGSLFDRFRCEMSISKKEVLSSLFLLEVEIDASIPKRGLTHNAYIGAVVIPELIEGNLIAVYKLDYKASGAHKFFYPTLEVLQILKEKPLFPSSFNCKDE